MGEESERFEQVDACVCTRITPDESQTAVHS